MRKKMKLWLVAIAVLMLGCVVSNGQHVQAASAVKVQARGTCYYSKAYDVLKLVNKERKKAGASALVMDKELMKAAMQRAAESALYLDSYHSRPDGTTCFTVTDKMDGENIAWGFDSASMAMKWWMNSPMHKMNILMSQYQSIGIGCFKQDGSTYWVQCFGVAKADKLTKPSDKKKTYTIKILPSNLKLSVKSKSITVKKNKTATNKFYATNTLGEKVRLIAKSLSYKSSKPKVAKISSGTIKGLKKGKAQITAYAGTAKVRYTVYVK